MTQSSQRLAIVTGASSGIGLEIVRYLKNEENLEIWLVARRKDRLESLVSELEKSGVRARALEMDLGKSESWSILEREVQNSSKSLQWLVNNAGFGYSGLFEDENLENVEGMIALNVMALSSITRRLLPYMHSGAHILNVASSIAFMPVSGYALYSATKSFVLTFSLALRHELKQRGITVSSLCPGPVATEFFDISSAEAPPKFLVEKATDTAFLAVEKANQGKAVIVTGLAAWIARTLGAILPKNWLAALSAKALMRDSVKRSSR